MRIQRIVLENHGHVALFRRQVVDDAVADFDFAGGDIFEAGDHAQQCRLAAAGGTDQNDELAIVNCDRDAVNHGRQSERLAHVANDDGRHCSSQLRVLFYYLARYRRLFYRLNRKTKGLSAHVDRALTPSGQPRNRSKGHAAVDEMRLSGDIARFVGAEKNRQRSHFLRGSKAPDRLAGDKCLAHGLK